MRETKTENDQEVGAGDDDLLTEFEARQVLPMSVSWFRRQRWLKQGPPFVRVGGRVFYFRRDLLTFVRARRVKAA